jgi:hypothetical protein
MTPILPEVEMFVVPVIIPVEVLVNEKSPPPDPVPSPVRLRTGPVLPPDMDP